jgi:Bacterial regulatory helix-turn-helix protein, lysR family
MVKRRASAASKLDVTMMHSFLTLMEENSVSKAATQLNMSQPALSHDLAHLGSVAIVGFGRKELRR